MMEVKKLESPSKAFEPLSGLKKWLNVPFNDLERILKKYISDPAMLMMALVEIQAFSHETYEDEPEKD